MKRRHPYLEQLQRRAEQAKSSASSAGKPIDEMGAEELEAELERLRWEMRKLEIEDLAAREQAAQRDSTGSGGPRAFIPRRQNFVFPKRQARPKWK